MEVLEVAQQKIAGKFLVFYADEIFQCLRFGVVEIFPRAFVFDQQGFAPEQVNESLPVIEFLDGFLEGGDFAAADAEHFKESVVEGLRFAFFVAGIAPFCGKTGGIGADFVPA